MKTLKIIQFVSLSIALSSSVAAVYAAPVYSNHPTPGDSFTNPTSTNQGQAVDTSGWYYNNVRNGATIGINIKYPRSGNGSVWFSSPTNGKADIEYLPNAVSLGGNYVSAGSLGNFSDLSSMSYEWFRDTSSTANSNLHPSLRVLLDADGDLTTTGDRGGLVFERSYNNKPTIAGSWQNDTISGSTYLWNFGLGLGNEYDLDHNGYAYDSTLADWQNYLKNAKIIGFSSGVGSGWGPFSGAVDNISWTIAGVTSTSNFEVRGDANVPEPATLALVALGVLGLGAMRRQSARP